MGSVGKPFVFPSVCGYFSAYSGAVTEYHMWGY